MLKFFLALVLLVAGAKVIFFSDNSPVNLSDETKHKAGAAASVDFAKCLNEKGAIMYGIDTCEHCQMQKKMFGDAFENIKYINCYFEKERCAAEGIPGYPVWQIGNKKISGIQTFSSLSALTGCMEPIQ